MPSGTPSAAGIVIAGRRPLISPVPGENENASIRPVGESM